VLANDRVCATCIHRRGVHFRPGTNAPERSIVTECKQCRGANTLDPAAALLAPVDDGTFDGLQSDETMDNLSAEASKWHTMLTRP
jgi:hypothetical protein